MLPRPDTFSGSIPACAGEPKVLGSIAISQQVYPRVCGGTLRRWRPNTRARGLSPRVRGNHLRILPVLRHARSIPACAGEPLPTNGSRTICAVYPRVCGGTHYLNSF